MIPLALASSCQTPVPAADAAMDAPASLEVVLVDTPVSACDRIELLLDVRRGAHVAGLAASDFTWTVTQDAPDASLGAPQPIANACFGESVGDGGAGIYRACFTGLAASTGYYFTTQVMTPGGATSSTFFVPTTPCDEAGMDGAMDDATLPVDDLADADDAGGVDAGGDDRMVPEVGVDAAIDAPRIDASIDADH